MATADKLAALDSSDTIVAISTPPGRGGIGIVRLSGVDAIAITVPMLRLNAPLAHAHARFAEIVDSSPQNPSLRTESPAVIDQAIVTLFVAPNSYTGEDLVEIAAHGSPIVLDLLLRQAMQRGARLAGPGEFTQRAFLSGRIDLTQAEAVRDLIDAQTVYQARVAASQLGGALSRRIQPAKDILLTLIATVEAGIDFAEDDIDVIPSTEIFAQIGILRNQLEPIAKSFGQGRIIHTGVTLAIVGEPNVGKSSLFNRLVERERAIVTATPGTTRDLVTERVSLGGIPVNLVDTAGLREAIDEAEAIGVQKSREALADAEIVLVVIDAARGNLGQGRDLLTSLEGRPVIIVRNKIDLLAGSGDATDFTGETVAVSAKTGEGIPLLRERLLAVLRGANAEDQIGMLTNLRQYEAIVSSMQALEAAARSAAQQVPHEMIMLDLYSALRSIDMLTGQTTSDDILNQIFSSFCIGK